MMGPTFPGWVNPEGYTLEQALKSVGEGWSELIKKVFDTKADTVKITQVKEKFGGLCIYYSEIDQPFNREFEQFLTDIERLSLNICEWCGQDGSLDNRYWWVLTLCKSCKTKRKISMTKKGIKPRA